MDVDFTPFLHEYEARYGPSLNAREFVKYIHAGQKKKKYNIIVADPPWMYSSQRMVQRDKFTGVDDEYDTMTLQDMCDLPIQSVCDTKCVLYMWTTGPKLEDAFKLIRAWGFKYSTVAFVWDKRIPNPGVYSISQVEYVLVAKRGTLPKRVKYNTRQLLSETRTVHSKKPEEIQNRIDAHYAHRGVKKLELFARRFRPGWDCVGNELNGTIQDFLAGKKMQLRAAKK